MVYPALLQLMRTPLLPVVDWTDAPADLNGLVRFAERRNLVSARVQSHFKRNLPQDLTSRSPVFCPHTAFLCFVLFSEQTAILYLHCINWLVFYSRDGQCLLCGPNWIFKCNTRYFWSLMRRPGFDPRPVHARFVVDKVTLGQDFLRVLRVSPVTNIRTMLRIHL